MTVRTLFDQWMSKQERRLGSRQLDNGSEPEDILFDFVQTMIDDQLLNEAMFTSYLEGLYSDDELPEAPAQRSKRIELDGEEVSGDPRGWYAIIETNGPNDVWVAVYHPKDKPTDPSHAVGYCCTEQECVDYLIEEGWLKKK